MINDGCEKSELWDFNRDTNDLTERTTGTNQDSNEWDSLKSQKTLGTKVAKSVPAPGTGVS